MTHPLSEATALSPEIAALVERVTTVARVLDSSYDDVRSDELEALSQLAQLADTALRQSRAGEAAARAKALEDAARVCDGLRQMESSYREWNACDRCACAIRALSAPSSEPSTPNTEKMT
jgi:hypothetical protein